MEQNRLNLYRSVYKVNHQGGSGTCFFLKSPGYFITNYHVVEGYHHIAIEDTEENRFVAQVILASPALDLAIIQADGDFAHLPDLTIARESHVAMGERISVAGYPFGMPFSVTEGTVSAPRQMMNNRYYIQTDAAVNPGNSGGPMFDSRGEIVAVTVSKLTNADNMGFGIPVEDIHRLISGLESCKPQTFNLQCGGCEEAISTQSEYCPSCGAKLPAEAFKVKPLTDLAVFAEKAIERLGISPLTTRVGFESWAFYRGSAKLSLHVYNSNFLIFYCRIAVLPKKNVEEVLTYLLSDPIAPYQFGLDNNTICLYYCVHMSDLDSDHADDISEAFSTLAQKADELDDFLVDTYGCSWPERTTNKHTEISNDETAQKS